MNVSQFLNKHLPIILVLGLIFFHILANSLWIYSNQPLPSWDAALHIALTQKHATAIVQSHFLSDPIQFLRISQYYPPFVYIVTSPLSLLSHNNYRIVSISGSLFFSILLFFQYLYVEKVFKNNGIAVVSVFLLSFFITIYQQSRDHMLDLPLAALIMGGLYFFEKSNNFSKIKYTFLFSLCFSLSLLVKWYAPFFFLIPLGVSFLNHRKTQGFKLEHFRNITLSIVLTSLLWIPWYVVNFQQFIAVARVTSLGELSDPQNIFSLNNVFFYLKLNTIFQFTFLGLLLIILSCMVAVREKNTSRLLGPILTILFAYFFFTFIPNKNIRYLIPIMPWVSIILAIGVNYLLIHKMKILNIAGWGIMYYYFFTFLILSFGVPFFPKYKYAINFPLLGWVDIFYLSTSPVRVLPDFNHWPNLDILRDINSLSPGLKQNRILILAAREELNDYNFDPHVFPQDIFDHDTIQVVFFGFADEHRSDLEMKRYLETQVDYIVVPQITIGLPEAVVNYEMLSRYKTFVQTDQDLNFVKVKEYNVPATSMYPLDTLELYQNKTGPE